MSSIDKSFFIRILWRKNELLFLSKILSISILFKLILLFFNSDKHIKVTESSEIPPPSKIQDIPRPGKKISITSNVPTRKPRRPTPRVMPHKKSFTPHKKSFTPLKKIQTKTSRGVVVKKNDCDFDARTRKALRNLVPRPYMHQSNYRR